MSGDFFVRAGRATLALAGGGGGGGGGGLPSPTALSLSPSHALLAVGLSSGVTRVYSTGVSAVPGEPAAPFGLCASVPAAAPGGGGDAGGGAGAGARPPAPAPAVRAVAWLPGGSPAAAALRADAASAGAASGGAASAGGDVLLLALVSVDEDGNAIGTPLLRASDASSGAVLLDAPLPAADAPSALALSADGALLALAARGPRVLFFDVRAGLRAARRVGAYADSHAKGSVVAGVAFHASLPHVLLSWAEDGLVCAFDTRVAGEADAIVSVLPAGDAVVRCGAFGPHGAFAWVATAMGGLSLWNLGSAERVAHFPALAGGLAGLGPGASVIDVVYDDEGGAGGGGGGGGGRDGRLFLLAGDDAGALLWAAVTPAEVRPLALLPRAGGHVAGARLAAAARARPGADGLALFTAGEDGALLQWLPPALAAAAAGASAAAAGAGGGGGKERRAPGGAARHDAARGATAAAGDAAAAFASVAARAPAAT